MKQYAVGDTVWYRGDEAIIRNITDRGYACIQTDTYIEHKIALTDLSPYPPVKAVQRYVVVDEKGDMYDEESQQPTEQLSIMKFCNWQQKTWEQLTQDGCRCIPVTITAKKD